MDFKKKGSYPSLKEGYSGGSAMSIYGALKGLTRRFDKNVECWCIQASHPSVKLPKEGAFYPMQLCSSCVAAPMKN
jgi:hypothetical protein|uniref:Uncharacterized protein n=1 Tax=viral metagenome TaxID=1070528 RepID=A0A6C0IDX7_9ZZZZ